MKSAHPSTEQQSHFTERSPRCEGRQASAGQKQPSGSGKRNQPASCQLRATRRVGMTRAAMAKSAVQPVDVASDQRRFAPPRCLQERGASLYRVLRTTWS
jgi:hypothetical protein